MTFNKILPSLHYAVGFVLLTVFCGWTYGDVFHHIGLDNFVCSDAEAMTFVRRVTGGTLFWGARYVLLAFRSQWLGAVLMAAVLTASAWCFDRLIPQRLRTMKQGAGFVPAVALLAYMVSLGYDLYIRTELSLFVVWTLVLFLISLGCAAVGAMLHLHGFGVGEGLAQRLGRLTRIPLGALVALLAYGALTWQALVPGENVRITCRQQNLMDEGEDWSGITAAARSCRQPSKSVAAYHAMALVQQNAILDHLFDIPYSYPEQHLRDVAGNAETFNYLADGSLIAGLPNVAYHESMQNLVIAGPRLRTYKRMALCALLNDEPALARRMMHIISQVPFEGEFAERFTPYIGHPEKLSSDPLLAGILALYPQERLLEQSYRQPTVLGYNAALLSGSQSTLNTSIATLMYSKSLDPLLVRTAILQRHVTLPIAVQQAILVASQNRPGLLNEYPQVAQNGMLLAEFQRFRSEAADYLNRIAALDDLEAKAVIRNEMGAAMRDAWLGTYYFYYYCGNIDAAVQQVLTHGVN